MTTSDPPAETTIVPVGPEHAAALGDLHAASFAEAWTKAALSRLLKADAARAFAAFSGYERTAVGFVLAFAAADEAEILTIAVAQAGRRQGIGTRLLRTLEAELATQGITRLFLEVAADNDPAYALYRRRGFVETGRRKGYYQRPNGPAVDALTLARTLELPTDDASDRLMPGSS